MAGLLTWVHLQGTADYLDCTGLLVLPAAIDMHVHMRGGTQSAKEDWKSGSMSALAGGVTVVVDQPNTVPPITTAKHLRDRVCDAQTNSWCNFAVNSSVTAIHSSRGDVAGRCDGIRRDIFCPVQLWGCNR